MHKMEISLATTTMPAGWTFMLFLLFHFFEFLQRMTLDVLGEVGRWRSLLFLLAASTKLTGKSIR